MCQVMGTARWYRSPWLIAVGILVVVLVAARIALPVVLERYVNKTLDELDGYSGSVQDIDVSLWRGAYQIEGLRIVKTGGKVPVPFVSAREIDLSVEWKALLDGSIVAEIDLFAPKLNFVNSEKPSERQTEVDKSWTDTVKELVPFDINRVAIHNGQVHYRDLEAKPRVDIFVQRIDATLRNLTNSEDLGGNLFASYRVSALAMGSGKITSQGRLNPYEKYPTFDIAFKLDGLELKQINQFLQAYANVDAEAGTISMDSEFSAKNGKFEGYAKPFIDHLQVLKWNEEKEGFFGKIWEAVAEAAGELLEDQDKDRIATRIPLRGSVEEPAADVWTTIGGILKNAFLESLRRGLEGSIGLGKNAKLAPKK
jgi:uncharacterized protein involved in outer membrane biogenesis